MLSGMLDHCGNKNFLRNHAQGFDRYPIITSYDEEEERFLITAYPAVHEEIPDGSNIFKIKHNNDGSLKLKARIAPHGNEDDMRHFFSKDCTTCAPIVLRILESISSLIG